MHFWNRCMQIRELCARPMSICHKREIAVARESKGERDRARALENARDSWTARARGRASMKARAVTERERERETEKKEEKAIVQRSEGGG